MSDTDMAACTQERLEDYLTRSGRELQRIAMQDYLDAAARREERRAVVRGADQVARRRAEPGHTRQLLTTVGPVEVSRIAYRASKAANLHPADAVLALPARLHSAPLQRAVVHEVADGPLRSAREALARATGQMLGTRQPSRPPAISATSTISAPGAPRNPRPQSGPRDATFWC
ncbi:hypothetical protein ACFXI6_54110 [Streptomyces mirabilis]|uniref:hypothetical protein n=1 Tax=Streptomyces mirabilis TaxID=68239 RepID=UPI003694B5FC